jgi:hypothetical protein
VGDSEVIASERKNRWEYQELSLLFRRNDVFNSLTSINQHNMFRSKSSMMRTARPLMAAARPATFESCNALCAEKRASRCGQSNHHSRALSTAARNTQQEQGSFTATDAVLGGCLLLAGCAILFTDVEMGDSSLKSRESINELSETMSLRPTIRSYEEVLAKGLTPTEESMIQAAKAYVLSEKYKEGLHLIDSLTQQGYQPVESIERNIWAEAYASTDRWNEATAILQAPMYDDAKQDHYRHYYLCNIYTQTNDMVSLKRIIAERKETRSVDVARLNAMRASQGVQAISVTRSAHARHTYRLMMFAYSGDIKSALAEIGQMQLENVSPTELQLKALSIACELNGRLDLLPLIKLMSVQ